jgi:heme oxygenase
MALEKSVGSIDSHASYVRYLRGLLDFRSPIEAALETLSWPRAFRDWRPTLIAKPLRDDLADVHANPLPERQTAVSFDTSTLFGTLYVLEGSSLGARLLYRDACGLGFSREHGARHLARQSEAQTWRSFIGLLDHAEDLEVSRAIEAANAAFDTARASMQRALDGR